ncbi:176_t:CDS:2 [Entrophospora sp. SA101]|nr:176_t:CDS:2 [Entrophospora sp. SA101]
MSTIKKWLDDAIKNEHINLYEYGSFVDFELIGKGACGRVFRARSTRYQKTMALKELNNVSFDLLVNEMKQHRKVESHDNIIRQYILVVEYADSGTLRSYLKKNRLSWDVKLKLGKQIVSAVACLHANEIVHRDLVKNILIHSGVAKLSDFGIAKRVIEPTSSLVKSLGSVEYSDPQYLKNQTYSRNSKSDTYSVGVLLWEISSGRIPFESVPRDYSLVYSIIEGNREKIIKGTPKKYVDVYKDCWNDDPEKRPYLIKVLEELEKVDINVLTDDDSSEINKNPGGDTNDNDNSQTKTSNLENEFEIPQTLSDTYNGYLNNYQPSSNPLSPMITENISRYIIPQELPGSSSDLKIYQPSSNPLSPMSTENNISRYIIPQELPGYSSDLKIYQELSNLPSPTIKSKKEIIDKIIKENFNVLSFTKHKEVSNNIQKSIEEQNVTSLEILKELISIQETSPIYLTLIGFFYYVGIGTPINKVESSKYFEKSNNLKEPTGQAWLGHLYENGEVGAEGKQDIKRAFELYLDSANKDNAFGQYRAGCCYASGKGISRNTCEATKLLKAALNNGEIQAKPRLEHIVFIAK